MADEFIKPLVSLIGISTLAATSRLLLSADRRSLRGFIRATFLSIFVGGITSGLIQGYHFTAETQGAIVGLCAFVADDILLAIIAIVTWVRQNPGRIFDIVLRRRGED